MQESEDFDLSLTVYLSALSLPGNHGMLKPAGTRLVIFLGEGARVLDLVNLNSNPSVGICECRQDIIPFQRVRDIE